ncbi:MAG: hypothetical protein EOO89_27910, partial [Pedobacter sp.]
LNTSFNYINDKFKFDASAEYFLISNHLYFVKNGATGILPAQAASDINLLRLSVGKRIEIGKFNIDLYAAYQKVSNTNVILTPELYTFNSIYYKRTFFGFLKAQIGLDIRYNTPYRAYSYSAPASQFYIGDPVTLGTKPVLGLWVKASLRKANLFVRYDYLDQGLFNVGHYTTNLYPMGDKSLKFGVLWNFYD